MNLGADMMGDKADDALTISGREPFSRISQAVGEAVDP